ncbi:hypothetical protein AS28_08217 [Pygoscelis adeliae]|uniref:Uncharacterized protein n=1 Tax=Pygoscelis adeliae TaxID=9238 RepID=A0A093NW54_PYGAD|nr:hypothetical protein AS28_08217 [Pygoscelis adeliae]
MLPSLKAAFALLSLLELISSRPLMTTSPKLKLSEITHRIQQLNAGVQVPCNDTRVAQVAFTDRKVKDDGEIGLIKPVFVTLHGARPEHCRSEQCCRIICLRGKRNCSLSNENEIYLRNFLPELGNFTQGMYRRLARSAAQ